MGFTSNVGRTVPMVKETFSALQGLSWGIEYQHAEACFQNIYSLIGHCYYIFS
jgi:hypothetical protein